MDLIDAIDSYKTSSAFYSAFEIGILDELYESSKSIEKLTQKLSIDPDMCKLLLFKLRELGLILNKDSEWYLEEKFKNEYSDIEKFRAQILHEINIYNKWMSPEVIVKSLRSGYGHRPFDKKGFTLEEQAIYDKAMYGQNVKMIALQLSRILRNREKMNIIEMGRSNGVIIKELKKMGFKFYNDTIARESIPDTNDYNVIILYNTIHYIDRENSKKLFDELKEKLNDNGILIIIDFFYEPKNKFKSNILIDWITHGGIYWIEIEELNEMMKESDFELTKDLMVKALHTNILLYRKRTALSQCIN